MADHSRSGIGLSTRAWGELAPLSGIWGAVVLAIAVLGEPPEPRALAGFAVIAGRRLRLPRRHAGF